MKNQHPASLAAQMLSRLSTMLCAVRRARLVVSIVAVVWLLSLGTALGQTTRTDYLNAKLGDKIEALGDFHERVSGTTFITVGSQVFDGPLGSQIVVPTEVIIDRITGFFPVHGFSPPAMRRMPAAAA
jgi:hypothetical protein